MAMASTKVSVVMCTYNGASYVAEQLSSIFRQSYPLHEVLIFDDQSTDNTVEVVESMIADQPHAKLVVNDQNIGFTRNFQQALVAASGDVIAISDQDDIWLEKKIEIMLNQWQPGAPAIYCNSIWFKDTIPAKIEADKRRKKFGGTDARNMFFANTVSGHAMIIRKSFLQLILPFKEGLMYDWWMAVVAAYNGGLQYCDEVLVLQRVHEKNVSIITEKRTEEENVHRHKLEAIKHCRQFVHAPNIPETHKRYALEFADLMEQSLGQKFSMPLFLFMVKNRHHVFFYKKKLISIFSHLKHSYRKAKGGFKAP